MTSRFRVVDALAADIAAAVLGEPPLLGATRLVCVDGPAGAGKSTLAAALDRSFRDALRRSCDPSGRAPVRTLHMDNLYDGWAGLQAGMDTMARSVIQPLRTGLPGRYRRFDWHGMRFAEERVVDPVDVLMVEGVGSGASAYDDAVSCLVWMDAPTDVRTERALSRDGEQVREHWRAWQRQERRMFARERPWDRADLVVDGSTGEVRRPPS